MSADQLWWKPSEPAAMLVAPIAAQDENKLLNEVFPPLGKTDEGQFDDPPLVPQPIRDIDIDMYIGRVAQAGGDAPEPQPADGATRGGEVGGSAQFPKQPVNKTPPLRGRLLIFRTHFPGLPRSKVCISILTPLSEELTEAIAAVQLLFRPDVNISFMPDQVKGGSSCSCERYAKRRLVIGDPLDSPHPKESSHTPAGIQYLASYLQEPIKIRFEWRYPFILWMLDWKTAASWGLDSLKAPPRAFLAGVRDTRTSRERVSHEAASQLLRKEPQKLRTSLVNNAVFPDSLNGAGMRFIVAEDAAILCLDPPKPLGIEEQQLRFVQSIANKDVVPTAVVIAAAKGNLENSYQSLNRSLKLAQDIVNRRSANMKLTRIGSAEEVLRDLQSDAETAVNELEASRDQLEFGFLSITAYKHERGVFAQDFLDALASAPDIARRAESLRALAERAGGRVQFAQEVIAGLRERIDTARSRKIRDGISVISVLLVLVSLASFFTSLMSIPGGESQRWIDSPWTALQSALIILVLFLFLAFTLVRLGSPAGRERRDPKGNAIRNSIDIASFALLAVFAIASFTLGIFIDISMVDIIGTLVGVATLVTAMYFFSFRRDKIL